jgi:site-specific DNA-methyltransferase (adenine-specific)
MSAQLYQGDCRLVLDAFGENSVDSCVTDPPYHLTSIVKRFGKPGSAPAQFGKDGAFARASRGFMGQEWDGGDIAFQPELWAGVLRVLKPGAHLIAFGGTRTYHRMATAIEDAGFEIRDQLAWVYGTGFPKSPNQGDGWGTGLKPAWEPVVFARKPLEGTVAQNRAKWGTGAINIAGCRVGAEERAYAPKGTSANAAVIRVPEHRAGQAGGEVTVQGRWPANVLHDGSEEVVAAFPQAPGQMADESRTAPSAKTSRVYGAMKRSGEPSQDSENVGAVGFKMRPGARRLDSGSAARFFYCAKASRSDRDENCGELPGAVKNKHPTVKPTTLMQYLCRLVTPPGGTVLDPFMGSGSTGKAALREGFQFVGIEQSAEYFEIAKRRAA